MKNGKLCQENICEEASLDRYCMAFFVFGRAVCVSFMRRPASDNQIYLQ